MKKQNILVGLVFVGSTVFFSGCATLLGGGGAQSISINSDKPLKASLKYTDGTGIQYFTTPATVRVDRRSKDIVIESKDDKFNPYTVKSELNPWFFGNIIFGGVLGSTTDSISGAAWRYDEKPVNIHANND
jgi:hypothetical protein